MEVVGSKDTLLFFCHDCVAFAKDATVDVSYMVHSIALLPGGDLEAFGLMVM